MATPRAIAPFVASPAPDPGVELDTLSEGENWFFSLACACGARDFVARSIFRPHYYLANRVSYGPVSLKCTACGAENVCFDPTKHGYDVEIDHFPPTGPYEGTVEDFACPSCGANAFRAITRFEYSSTHPEDDPNMFLYFTLIGECARCGEKVTITSEECA